MRVIRRIRTFIEKSAQTLENEHKKKSTVPVLTPYKLF